MKVTNLLKPNARQKKARARGWAKCLMANQLKATGEMYDDDGGRCCLAVAQDYAISCGVKVKAEKGTTMPHADVKKFFGWDDVNPTLNFFRKSGRMDTCDAASVNDGAATFHTKTHKEKGASHAEIAQLVLNTFVLNKQPELEQNFNL